MTPSSEQLAASIHAAKTQLAAILTERHFRRRPALEARYGGRGRAKCQEDAVFHLSYLAESIAVQRPEIFRDYISWAAAMLRSRAIPDGDLRNDLIEMKQVLEESFQGASAEISAALDAGLIGLDEGRSEPAAPVPEAALRYVEAALREGPLEATRVIDALINSGARPAEIYVEVLQPALHEIGRLWQLNKITVADEHYGTAVTQRVMTRIHSDHIKGRPRGAIIIVACVSGDLHEMGARMISDLLELDGYRSDYLGASTPAGALVEYVAQRGTRILVLSASTTPHLAQVRETIRLLRADTRCSNVKVMVGGAPFNLVPDLWRALGADGSAKDAAGAMTEVKRLLA